MMDYHVLLEVAMRASLEAGKAILDVYQSRYDVQFKADQSPVTAADLAAHRVLVELLSATDIPVLSEEGSSVDYAIRSTWEYYWLIDPLDGTKEFIHQNGEFTVNVALIHRDQPVLGVVFIPVTDDLFAGIVGGSGWHFPNMSTLSSTTWKEMNSFVIIPSANQDHYRVAVSRSHMDAATELYLQNLRLEKRFLETVSAGSSMKFCLVAQGRADEYPRFGPTMEWDTAAGHAILLSIGKNIYSLQDGDVIRYNKKEMINGPFVAR